MSEFAVETGQTFPVQPAATGTADDGTEALLDAIGPVAGVRLLLIGGATLDLMRAAIRRGCANTTALQVSEGLDTASAEIVFVAPEAWSHEAGGPSAGVFARLMRVLVPMGSLAVQVDPAEPVPDAAARVCSSLRASGFSAVRTTTLPDGRVVVLGERPSFSRQS